MSLKCDFLVSKFAFELNLYRYSTHDMLDGAGEQDIMEIPEMGEDAGEDEHDITAQVAAVPKYRANRVQTIGELDEEAHMLQRTDDADDDIDFSLLTSVLHSMEQVGLHSLQGALTPGLLGVRLLTWTVLAGINLCFDQCKIRRERCCQP